MSVLSIPIREDLAQKRKVEMKHTIEQQYLCCVKGSSGREEYSLTFATTKVYPISIPKVRGYSPTLGSLRASFHDLFRGLLDVVLH
jgi:hypothetical protein